MVTMNRVSADFRVATSLSAGMPGTGRSSTDATQDKKEAGRETEIVSAKLSMFPVRSTFGFPLGQPQSAVTRSYLRMLSICLERERARLETR